MTASSSATSSLGEIPGVLWTSRSRTGPADLERPQRRLATDRFGAARGLRPTFATSTVSAVPPVDCSPGTVTDLGPPSTSRPRHADLRPGDGERRAGRGDVERLHASRWSEEGGARNGGPALFDVELCLSACLRDRRPGRVRGDDRSSAFDWVGARAALISAARFRSPAGCRCARCPAARRLSR